MARNFVPASSYPVLALGGRGASRFMPLVAVLGGTALMTVSSWVQVPMLPVPMTMQTLAVTLIGAFYGWRLGALTILAWLAEAALGLPVLAGGGAGLVKLAGPTAGYLVAFVLVAGLVGLAAERRLLTRSVVLSAAVMLAANALILLVGWAWLAVLFGPATALTTGVLPFVAGGIVKALLAAGLIEGARGLLLAFRNRM